MNVSIYFRNDLNTFCRQFMTTTHLKAGSYFGTEVVMLVCFQVSTHHKHTGSLSSRQYSSSLYTSHTRLPYPPDSTVQVSTHHTHGFFILQTVQFKFSFMLTIEQRSLIFLLNEGFAQVLQHKVKKGCVRQTFFCSFTFPELS